MAKGKRYTQDQILSVLKEIEAGASIASVARSSGISDQTIYAWREKYWGMTRSDLAEMKALQEENRRLKNIVAELSLDNAALKEIAKAKWFCFCSDWFVQDESWLRWKGA
jgi:putative transposase